MLFENMRSFCIVLVLLALGVFAPVPLFSQDEYQSPAWWLVLLGFALPLYLVLDTHRHEGPARSLKVLFASMFFVAIGLVFGVVLLAAALSGTQ